MHRREWLRLAAVVPLATEASGRVNQNTSADGDLIVRQYEPRNQEPSLSALDHAITPTESFFVRSHFPMPKLDATNYRLKVEGRVEETLEFSIEEIKAMPSRTITALIECAGNGRVFLTPRPDGLLWGGAAVGVAEWTGVALSELLKRARVAKAGLEVVLEGADEGATTAEPRTPGTIRFARSVPLAKAHEDVLLAYAMNGEALSPEHGWPLRAVVPGWYGMASVKWLTRAIVVDRPFGGFYQTLDYSYFERFEGQPTLISITEIQVKAQIIRPSRGEYVPKGSEYIVSGVAWSGGAEIERVEVSTDGGSSWSNAELVGKSSPLTWRPWRFTWAVKESTGPRSLMARATDSRGRTQPLKRDPDRRTYMINHVVPVEVLVR
jgi:DMSO/TMAO reductase YedYZ molybdopterin-dependent catalytic subunit